MYRNFCSQNFYTFLVIWTTCIAIIMYCLRLFLLFTGKQHCLLKQFFQGTYLQRISVFMQNFKFGGVTVLAVQLFNKIRKKKKMLYFPDVMSKYIYFC